MPAIVFEDSYIYVFGGYEGSGRIDSIEQYDVASDQWSVLPIKFPLSVEAGSRQKAMRYINISKRSDNLGRSRQTTLLALKTP
jgi:hypothetical protein